MINQELSDRVTPAFVPKLLSKGERARNLNNVLAVNFYYLSFQRY